FQAEDGIRVATVTGVQTCLFRSLVTALAMGSVFAAEAGLMVLTSRWGKLKARDRLLSRHAWRGDEQVLDVGCGRGLLLLGAAKRSEERRVGKGRGRRQARRWDVG